MTVFKRLQEARVEISKRHLKKSGKNKFAGYEYYELGDFLPTAHEIFQKVGLCGIFSLNQETASLMVYDVDKGYELGNSVNFFAPTVMAHNPKGQPIQDLGGTLTYFRRYLWMLALELTESDLVDAIEPAGKPKLVQISEPKPTIDKSTGEIKPPPKMEGNGKEWNFKIQADADASAEKWISVVKEAADIMLSVTKSKEDVNTIFTTNRNIFNKLKELSAEEHSSLMNVFKARKESFKE